MKLISLAAALSIIFTSLTHASNSEEFDREAKIVKQGKPAEPDPDLVPLTMHKFTTFEGFDTSQFGEQDVLVFGVNGIITNHRVKKENQPLLGTFMQQLTAKGIPCFMLRYSNEGYESEIEQSLADQGISLCEDLDQDEWFRRKGGYTHKGSIFGASHYQIGRDLKRFLFGLTQQGKPKTRIIYFEEDYELIANLRKAKLDFPIVLYYKMSPESVTNTQYLRCNLIEEPELQWLLEEDVTALAVRISANPELLLRTIFKPFPDHEGLNLRYALRHLDKSEAMSLAIKNGHTSENFLLRSLALVYLQSTDYIYSEQLKQIADVYDAALWPHLFVVASAVFTDHMESKDRFPVFMALAATGLEFLQHTSQLDPAAAFVNVMQQLLRGTSPQLQRTLSSERFVVAVPNLGRVLTIATTLASHPHQFQDTAAAFLWSFTGQAEQKKLQGFYKKSSEKWLGLFNKICPPVIAMNPPEAIDPFNSNALYYMAVLDCNRELHERVPHWTEYGYHAAEETLLTLTGAPKPVLAAIPETIQKLIEGKFLKEEINVSDATKVIEVYKTCATSLELITADNLVRLCFNMVHGQDEFGFLYPLSNMPAAQRKALEQIMLTFHKNKCRNGCHREDLTYFLKRMAELPVEIIDDVRKDMEQELRALFSKVAHCSDEEWEIRFDFHDLSRLLEKQVDAHKFKFSWEKRRSEK